MRPTDNPGPAWVLMIYTIPGCCYHDGGTFRPCLWQTIQGAGADEASARAWVERDLDESDMIHWEDADDRGADLGAFVYRLPDSPAVHEAAAVLQAELDASGGVSYETLELLDGLEGAVEIFSASYTSPHGPDGGQMWKEHPRVRGIRPAPLAPVSVTPGGPTDFNRRVWDAAYDSRGRAWDRGVAEWELACDPGVPPRGRAAVS